MDRLAASGLETLLVIAARNIDELREDLIDIEEARAAASHALETLEAENNAESELYLERRRSARAMLSTLDEAAAAAWRRLELVEREYAKLTRLIAAAPDRREVDALRSA